jgi:cell shape-determining protein MreC
MSDALDEITRLKEENERLKKLLEIRSRVPGIIRA